MTPGRDCVALFAGINVGGHRPVKMAELRTMFEEIGLRDAVTYVQSGNVAFEAGEHPPREVAQRIEEAFQARFGFRSLVLARSRGEWAAMIAGNPFAAAEADPTKLHALVLADEPKPEGIAALRVLDSAPDRWELGAGVLYLHTPEGLGRSKFAPRIGRALGSELTQRNWRTVLALAELMADARDAPVRE